MNWDSPADFFAMGGHGLFVWGSYAVCALALLIEPILAARRHRQAQRQAQDEPLGDDDDAHTTESR